MQEFRTKDIVKTCLVTLAIFVFSQVAHAAKTPASRPWAIFGADDRHEVFEEADRARRSLAGSVVAMISTKLISTNRTGDIQIKANIYGSDYELCPTERFVDQPDAADCSGFLVTEKVIATAGHCVEEKNFCKHNKFVFGYMYDSKSRDPLIAKQDDVYGCKRVITEMVDEKGSDYALVELDRPVVGRTPLPIAPKRPELGDGVFIIGSPVGLPAKIAGGASVLSHDSGFYITDLDAFTGNSGAAVFNERNEVAGVLVRGEDDFTRKSGCYVAKDCKTNRCDGEDVTDPEVISAALAKYLGKRPRH